MSTRARFLPVMPLLAGIALTATAVAESGHGSGGVPSVGGECGSRNDDLSNRVQDGRSAGQPGTCGTSGEADAGQRVTGDAEALGRSLVGPDGAGPAGRSEPRGAAGASESGGRTSAEGEEGGAVRSPGGGENGADGRAGVGASGGTGRELSVEVDPTLELPDDQRWIFVDKSERRMVVNDGRGWREAFHVALGPHPVGDKEVEGDGRTPEGEFYVCRRVRHDRFSRFLGLSYPAPEDAERGLAQGLIQPIEYRAILRAARHRRRPPWRTRLGGNVGIHGYGRRLDRAERHARGEDWTDGCIAVTNEEIERIFRHVRLGTRVVIVP